jgi:guanylate kinase
MNKRIILCGKSGSGKDYLLKTLNLKQVITHTTRPKRDYEIDGVHKWFHTNLKENDIFSIVNDTNTIAVTMRGGKYFYWTDEIDFTNENDIWIIDINGILSIKKRHKDKFKVIYLDCPLWKRIRNMRKRNESWKSIWQRIRIDYKEFKPIKNIEHTTIKF